MTTQPLHGLTFKDKNIFNQTLIKPTIYRNETENFVEFRAKRMHRPAGYPVFRFRQSVIAVAGNKHADRPHISLFRQTGPRRRLFLPPILREPAFSRPDRAKAKIGRRVFPDPARMLDRVRTTFDRPEFRRRRHARRRRRSNRGMVVRPEYHPSPQNPLLPEKIIKKLFKKPCR